MEEKLDPKFEAAYTNWMEKQRKMARGERRRRLNELNEKSWYAEKLFLRLLWWPAFGSLDNLQPEYEVKDFKDGYRFIDLVFKVSGIKIAIEIDPFGTHLRDIDRWKYNDNLMRHNHLIIDNWKLLRFSLDHIKNNPRLCEQLLQQALGKWMPLRQNYLSVKDPIERAIVNQLIKSNLPLSPKQIKDELGWHHTTVKKKINKMAAQGYLLPAKPGAKRNRAYFLNSSIAQFNDDMTTK